jgi:2Fe-2S ferredoxin
MPKVIFIEHNGARHEVDVPNGLSVMKAALENNIPGIDGDCGGVCACATCHVFVEPPWCVRTLPRNAREEDMLGFASGNQEFSRLACQISVTEEMNGLIVRLPQSQH